MIVLRCSNLMQYLDWPNLEKNLRNLEPFHGPMTIFLLNLRKKKRTGGSNNGSTFEMEE